MAQAVKFEGLKYAIDVTRVEVGAMTVVQVLMFVRQKFALDATRDLVDVMTVVQVLMLEARKFATDAIRAEEKITERRCFSLKVEAPSFVFRPFFV